MEKIVALTLDMPGINVTIQAEVRTLQNQEMSVVGFKRGYNGTLTHGRDSKDDYEILTATNVSNRISYFGNPSAAAHVLTPRQLRSLDAKQELRRHDYEAMWRGSDPGVICRYAEEHPRSRHMRCRVGKNAGCDYPQLKRSIW